jgi:hypothetical protein
MQTLAVQVEDNHSNDITISKDRNLELDSYFYERQKQLHQDLEEVESGKAEMISHDDLWNNINKHLKSLNC